MLAAARVTTLTALEALAAPPVIVQHKPQVRLVLLGSAILAAGVEVEIAPQLFL